MSVIPCKICQRSSVVNSKTLCDSKLCHPCNNTYCGVCLIDMKGARFSYSDGCIYAFTIYRCQSCYELKIKPGREPVTTNIPVPSKLEECTLLSDLGAMLSKGSFYDVTFIVSGKEFSAHKNILSARSVVFEKMFQQKMSENLTNKVDLKDIEPDVFQELLEYIYTGKVKNLEKMAPDLLDAAFKYELKHLKGICNHYLQNNLTVNSCISTVVRASLYDLEVLKKIALIFMKKNLDKLVEHPSWFEFMKNYPVLLTEVIKTK